MQKMINKYKFKSSASRTIANMQFKQRRSKWLPKEKDFALKLFYKSPVAYSFVRSNGIVLPGESTIRKWIGKIEAFPVLNDIQDRS